MLHFLSATVDLYILPRNTTCLVTCQKQNEICISTIGTRSAHKAKIARLKKVDILVVGRTDATGQTQLTNTPLSVTSLTKALVIAIRAPLVVE